MIRPLRFALLLVVASLAVGSAASADIPKNALWLGAGTAENPLVHGAPKYCTTNQRVEAWASDACHFARLAWADAQPPAAPKRIVRAPQAAVKPRVADAKPQATAKPQVAEATEAPAVAEALPTLPPAAPRAPMVPRSAPTMDPDDVATDEPTPMPTRTPLATRPRRPTYSSGGPDGNDPTPMPAPRDGQAKGPDPDVRYTPSTAFAWTASRRFASCFANAGGAEPLDALTQALQARDITTAIDDANRVSLLARPCEGGDAASALGLSELAVLQTWLYSRRDFWLYADVKLRLAQTQLDTAAGREGFPAIDPARVARLRTAISSLRTLVAAHPE